MKWHSRQFTTCFRLRAQDAHLTQRYINQVSQLSHCEWHVIVVVQGLLTTILIMKKFNVGWATDYKYAENQLLRKESWVRSILFKTTAGVIKMCHSGSKIPQSLFADHSLSVTGHCPFSHCLYSSHMWLTLENGLYVPAWGLDSPVMRVYVESTAGKYWATNWALSFPLPPSVTAGLFIDGMEGRCHFGSRGEDSPVLLLSWEMREEWKNLEKVLNDNPRRNFHIGTRLAVERELV